MADLEDVVRIIAGHCAGYVRQGAHARPMHFGIHCPDQDGLWGAAPQRYYTHGEKVMLPEVFWEIATGTKKRELREAGIITLLHYKTSARRIAKQGKTLSRDPKRLKRWVKENFGRAASIYVDGICNFSLLLGNRNHTREVMTYFKENPSHVPPILQAVIGDHYMVEGADIAKFRFYDRLGRPRKGTIEYDS